MWRGVKPACCARFVLLSSIKLISHCNTLCSSFYEGIRWFKVLPHLLSHAFFIFLFSPWTWLCPMLKSCLRSRLLQLHVLLSPSISSRWLLFPVSLSSTDVLVSALTVIWVLTSISQSLCNHHLRNISKIRSILTFKDTETILHALILSLLDYCNSLFTSLSQKSTNRLQYVQNSAARLLTRTK